MSSFINLMADDVWSEADIVNRTEAIIAAEFPPAQHAILQRKVQGQALGVYQLTEQEQQELGLYAMLSESAGDLADAARADMALLRDALAMEAAFRELAAIPDDDEHYEARQAVQERIDAFPQMVEDLVIQRAEHRASLAPEPESVQEEAP